MPYDVDFLNTGNFLGTYAVDVLAAVTNQIEGGGQTVDQLTTGGTFSGAQTRFADLVAPQGHAYFSQKRAAQNTLYIGASVEELRIKIGAVAANTVPVHIIPYAQSRALGVKLPADPGPLFNDAYALTATQNGCTVEISGTRQAPYASHSNARSTDTADRPKKLGRHLKRLQQQFNAKELIATGAAGQQGASRTQFGNYANPRVANHKIVAAETHYGAHYRGIAQTQAARHRIKGARRVSKWWGHQRFEIEVAANSLNVMNDPAYPPNAIVMGHRHNGLWTFYYQIYTSINFHVRKVSKMKGIRLKSEYVGPPGNPTDHYATVIVDHGELWPNFTSNPIVFG